MDFGNILNLKFHPKRPKKFGNLIAYDKMIIRIATIRHKTKAITFNMLFPQIFVMKHRGKPHYDIFQQGRINDKDNVVMFK